MKEQENALGTAAGDMGRVQPGQPQRLCPKQELKGRGRCRSVTAATAQLQQQVWKIGREQSEGFQKLV